MGWGKVVDMTDTELHSKIMQALKENADDRLPQIGAEMARFKTELGMPPDMFLKYLKNKMELTENDVIVLADAYCTDMIEHKKASGATDKALDRARQHNKAIMRRLITTGEMGEF